MEIWVKLTLSIGSLNSVISWTVWALISSYNSSFVSGGKPALSFSSGIRSSETKQKQRYYMYYLYRGSKRLTGICDPLPKKKIVTNVDYCVTAQNRYFKRIKISNFNDYLEILRIFWKFLGTIRKCFVEHIRKDFTEMAIKVRIMFYSSKWSWKILDYKYRPQTFHGAPKSEISFYL